MVIRLRLSGSDIPAWRRLPLDVHVLDRNSAILPEAGIIGSILWVQNKSHTACSIQVYTPSPAVLRI